MEFTVCDTATTGDMTEWMSVLREYMWHYLRLVRPTSTAHPDVDPDIDRDAALLLLVSEGGLTLAAAEDVVRRLERLWDEEKTAHEKRLYFGHFMASQLAMSYVEQMLEYSYDRIETLTLTLKSPY